MKRYLVEISTMPFDRFFAPDTHAPLSKASAALVDELNRRIAEGELIDNEGNTIETPLEGGWVEGDRLFPLRGDIPALHVDAVINVNFWEGDERV